MKTFEVGIGDRGVQQLATPTSDVRRHVPGAGRVAQDRPFRSYCSWVGTQLAAVMVTDLVDSTETRVRLGEDGAESLRRTHDQMLRAVVADNGGVFVKGLGDGMLAHF